MNILINNIRGLLLLLLIGTMIYSCASNPDDLSKGQNFIEKQKYDSAVVYLTKYLDKEPQSIEALRLKALAEIRKEDYFNAKATLNSLKNIVEADADLLTDYGNVLYKIGLVDSAKLYFDKAFELDSNAINLNYNLAVLHFNDFANDSLALRHIDNEIKIQPGDVNNLLLKGNILLELDKYEKADSIVREVLLLTDTSTQALELAGQICFKQKNYDCAIANYSNAIKLKNNNPRYFIRRASALALQDQYAEALIDCSTALSLDSLYIDGYIIRIAIYDKINEPEKACSDLRKIRTIDPNNSVIFHYQSLNCN